jgi:hypothetical protein
MRKVVNVCTCAISRTPPTKLLPEFWEVLFLQKHLEVLILACADLGYCDTLQAQIVSSHIPTDGSLGLLKSGI